LCGKRDWAEREVEQKQRLGRYSRKIAVIKNIIALVSKINRKGLMQFF